MAQVSYDYSSTIKTSNQKADYDGTCAATCAAMCVKKTTDDLVADGLTLVPVTFSSVAAKYNYTCADSSSITGTAAILLDKLKTAKRGVIIKQNNTDQHWVVVTGFSGDDTAPKYADFTCYDPLKSSTSFKALTNSWKFEGFFRHVIFTPK